jgi:hypothetical protein
MSHAVLAVLQHVDATWTTLLQCAHSTHVKHNMNNYTVQHSVARRSVYNATRVYNAMRRSDVQMYSRVFCYGCLPCAQTCASRCLLLTCMNAEGL